MSLFRRKKVDIEIVKTESVKSSGVAISVRNKKAIRKQLSAAEIDHVADQLADLARPKIVQRARQLRSAGRIDEAFVLLHEGARRRDDSPEIVVELRALLDGLAKEFESGSVKAEQLANIFFTAAGFELVEKESTGGGVRLTVALRNGESLPAFDSLPGSSNEFYCYCSSDTSAPLDTATLGWVQKNLESSTAKIHRRIHFVACSVSNPTANMVINLFRVTHSVTTIPLELVEMFRALWHEAAAGELLQSKLHVWQSESVFASTRPVSGQDAFFGREAALAEINDVIKRRQSFYILGGRRMGKTSLIKHLQALGVFRRFLYAFYDLEGAIYPGDSLDDVIEKILEQWADSLRKRYPVRAEDILSRLEEYHKSSAADRLDAFLDALERANRTDDRFDCQCLVILDDLNWILEGENPLWERGGRALLRRLRHRQDFVITGLTMWDFQALEYVESGPGGGLAKYTPIYLSPMSVNECKTMIDYIAGIIGLRFGTTQVADLYLETGGQPLWTRYLCDSISRKLKSDGQREVTEEYVDAAVSEFSTLYPRLLPNQLDSLTGDEKRVVANLCLGPEGQSVESRSLGKRSTLQRLAYYGLVEEVERSYYRLRMGLLRRYVRESGWTAS